MEIAYPKGPVPPCPPPNHKSSYILGFGGLDFHLGELNFDNLPLEIRWDLHIPKVPGPRVPQTILIITICDLVVWVIIWEN